jgi:WD40 repeat protein
VNYAVQQGKRIFTVLCRETDVARLPEALKTLQWLDFSRAEAFDTQFPELVQTLELDREHAHQHTVLQQRANEWLDNAQSRDFLLNLSACQKAETWLAATDAKQPHPTRLQGEYIQASRTAIEQIRRKEQRRQRIILGSVLLGMLIAIVLASFAWERSIEAEKQTLLATAQKAEAEKQKAEAWREKAIAQENYKKVHINSAKGLARYADILRKEGDYTRALRVAQLAYETNPEPETSLPEVDQVLNEVYNDVKLHGSGRFYQLRYNLELGIAKYSKRGKILEAHGAIVSLRNEKGEILRRFNHGSDIASVAFSSDESLIAAGGKDNSLKVWDELGQPHTFQTTQKCAAYPELECQVSDIIFPSKQTVLSINQSENDYNELLLWDIHQEKLLKIQAIGLFKLGAISYAYSDNQQYMAVIILQAEQWTVQVWKTSDLSLRYTTVISRSPDMKGFLSTKLTDDGQKLIIASPDDKQLFRIVSLKNNQQRQLSKHNEAITALAVAPDKQSFASGGKNGEVIVWSFEGKIKHKRQSHHKNTVNDLQYSDDSQLLLSASDDKSAILWSLASDSIQVFSSQYPIWIASFISNSLISTISYGYGSTENYLALWSATPQTSYAYRVYNPIIEIANSQQDKFFEFLVDDNSAYIHLFSNKINELALLQSWIPLELENTVPIVLDFLTVPLTQKKTRPKLRLLGSNREKEWLITGGSDGIFRIYDLQGHLVTSWESTFCKTGLFKKSCQFNDTTVSQMGNILVENNGRDIVVWDIYGRKKKQFVLTNLYFGSPYAMKITPDEHYLILSDGGENQVHVFDLTTGYVLRSINLGKANEFKATTQELIFLKTLSYNGKERMVMQRIPLFGNAQPIIQPLNSVEANLLEVSASGERTLISAGNKLEVWGKNSKKPLQTLMFNQNQEGYINGALFLQNDDLVIGSESNGKNYIYLWPSTKHIYEWAKNSKDIYQLTAEDKEELRMEE